MSHVGLLPHKVHLLGGFKMQGKTANAAIEIIENAKPLRRWRNWSGNRSNAL